MRSQNDTGSVCTAVKIDTRKLSGLTERHTLFKHDTERNCCKSSLHVRYKRWSECHEGRESATVSLESMQHAIASSCELMIVCNIVAKCASIIELDLAATEC